MRQNIFVTALLLFVLCIAAPSTAQETAGNGKSEAEKTIQQAARIRSNEINYAYISLNMLKQMLPIANIADNEAKQIFGKMKSIRRFCTTGGQGYRQLYQAMQPFLQEEDNVMGLELMALTREDGMLSVVYSNDNNLLVINDCGNNTLTVVFIVGLPYSAFKILNEGEFSLDFDLF
ncbi:MAG: DUF4252 domain-containing protein [Bacteroidaceae bacterium]|nr:DUF4252 domain-containing protein [Bacteroidaceae bacterium]